jgi:hypothetical protein
VDNENPFGPKLGIVIPSALIAWALFIWVLLLMVGA